MDILRQVIGLALIVIAWVNPFSLAESFRMILFILGFDMITFLFKFVALGIDYFLGLGIGLLLTMSILADVVTKFFFPKSFLDLILKPLAVFFILYLSNLGLEISIIVAGIDLLLNITKKWI